MSNQTARIHRLLSELYKPHQARLFLKSPQALLGDKIPNDLIDAGRGAEVERVLRQFLDGAYL
jgi:uncharacterized protein (DUF2384 family)